MGQETPHYYFSRTGGRCVGGRGGEVYGRGGEGREGVWEGRCVGGEARQVCGSRRGGGEGLLTDHKHNTPGC